MTSVFPSKEKDSFSAGKQISTCRPSSEEASSDGASRVIAESSWQIVLMDSGSVTSALRTPPSVEKRTPYVLNIGQVRGC